MTTDYKKMYWSSIHKRKQAEIENREMLEEATQEYKDEILRLQAENQRLRAQIETLTGGGSTTSAPNRATGVILSAGNSYGFISVKDTPNVFFHVTDCHFYCSQESVGKAVTFQTIQGAKGLVAKHVKLET